MTIVTGPSAHPLRPKMTEAVLTRRTLLRLLGAPLVLRAAAALTQEADTHLRLWLGLDTALKSRDRATILRDRLEAVSYPRVGLPHDRGARHRLPPRYPTSTGPSCLAGFGASRGGQPPPRPPGSYRPSPRKIPLPTLSRMRPQRCSAHRPTPSPRSASSWLSFSPKGRPTPETAMSLPGQTAPAPRRPSSPRG